MKIEIFNIHQHMVTTTFVFITNITLFSLDSLNRSLLYSNARIIIYFSFQAKLKITLKRFVFC